MRALAVCQDELVIRTIHRVLTGAFDVHFLVENRPLARRLVDEGLSVTVADPTRLDTYLRLDLSPTTCVIIEDNGRRSLKRIVGPIRDAGGSLLYVLQVKGSNRKSQDELRALVPEITHLDLAALLAAPLTTELGRSLTRARVQQYQRYFSDADRVLILLHNDPDPDALAAGLALRNVLRRTRTTAIIAALRGITRPENLRMADLLDIQVETITPDEFAGFDRIATVDVQPHYFGDVLPRVDLVIDHHPEQPGYTTVFKDIRAEYRIHLYDSDRASASRGRQHLRTHGHGDAVCDQVRHAVLRTADQPCGPRGLHVLVPDWPTRR